MTALLTIESLTFHEVRPIRLEKETQIIELPIRPDYAPNVFIKVTGYRDGEICRDGWEVLVHPRQRVLDVKVATDKPTYRPGEPMHVTVSTEMNGRAAASEVELAIVDESIFDLEDDRSPDLRYFFMPLRFGRGFFDASAEYYDSYHSLRGAVVGTRSDGFSFTTAGDRRESFQSSGLFAEAEAPEPQVAAAVTRRDFRDTMHYAGRVKTDDDGRAVVTIDTPGNLTRWRLIARAVSDVDRFGVGRSEAVTRKNVMVRLAAPRFFTDGDHATVRTVVHNDLDEAQTFTVSLAADGAQIDGAPRRIEVAPGQVVRIDWPVAITGSGPVKLTAQALSPRESDAMELTIPVHDRLVEAVVTQSAALDQPWTTTVSIPAEVKLQSARLDFIIVEPSVSAVRDVLPFLAGYPYGCTEQTMSRFLPAVVAQAALRESGVQNALLQKHLPEMIRQGLQRLYAFQHVSGDASRGLFEDTDKNDHGGWGWWKDDASDPFMTAYVV
jgi:uncharacterized protein YfaS (alpha-2-macroglobulin family)